MPARALLRQARERLGLTYRDVEQASYELAAHRGRPEFIIHISRLADFENNGATPSLHKLYSLCAIYHLDPMEVIRWYDVPFEKNFLDGLGCPAPKTHPAGRWLQCLSAVETRSGSNACFLVPPFAAGPPPGACSGSVTLKLAPRGVAFRT
jgi:transcriptional regulator with XRE-family HTH domain